MAAKTGIALPFGTTLRGRVRIIGGNAQLRKIILLNLADLESANPFQAGIGLGGDLIFAVNNNQLQAELRRRIVQTFKRLQLQDRARLAKLPIFTVNSEEQVLDVFIEYINIEENKAQDVQIQFSTVTDSNAQAALVGSI